VRKDYPRSLPEQVLLARERDHPVRHAEIVADGELVATVADEAVDVRDDTNFEEVVVQVGVSDDLALPSLARYPPPRPVGLSPWLTLT
jgi:hypothetical protein